MQSRLIDLTIGLNGKQRLTVELDGDFRHEFDKFKDKDVDITVKKYRHKRSLVQEAQGLGIETKTNEEIESLLKEYNKC